MLKKEKKIWHATGFEKKYAPGEKVIAAERALATFFSSFPLFSHLGDAFSCLSIFEP